MLWSQAGLPFNIENNKIYIKIDMIITDNTSQETLQNHTFLPVIPEEIW